MSLSPFALLQMLKRFGGGGGSGLGAAVTGLQDAIERLKHITVEGASGGGLVRVTANAARTIKSIDIDASIIGKKAVVEDLVRTAVNDALEKAAAAESEEQKAMATKLAADMPAMLSQLMGSLSKPGGGGGQMR
jgi:nucleoid-associated protein EbfC